MAAFVTLLSLLGLCVNQNKLPWSSGEVELLFPAKSSSLSWLDKEREIFENSYTDTIALSVPADSSIAELDFLLEQLEEDLLALEGIQTIVMPTQHRNLFGLVSSDEKHLRLVLKINSTLEETERTRLNAQIKAVLGHYASLTPIRAGSFVTTQEVAAAVSAETRRVIPWVILALVVVLILSLADWRIAALVLTSTLLSIGSALLAYSALGYPLGPISQLAPPFLLAIGAAFNLHFASRLMRTQPSERKGVIGELRWGIGLAAITTALSLATLSFMNITDVTRFAILAGTGTLLAAFYAVTLQAPFFKSINSKQPGAMPFNVELLFNLMTPTTIWATLALCIILGFGVARLEIHTDPLRFLPKDNNALAQINALNLKFPGNHYLSLILSQSEAANASRDLSFLSVLGARLTEIKYVERVISPHDFEKQLEKSHLADFFSDFSLRDSPVPSEFLSDDRKHLRILIETQAEGKELMALKRRIAKTIDREPSLRQFDAGITSLELIMAEQTSNIVYGLLKSLSMTISIVFVLLLLIFKSIKLALIGLVPNVLPLLSVFGLLGFTSRDFDFGSCLVATSALGIAVDNTFHFLLCWRRQSLHCDNLIAATKKTVNIVLYPFALTSFALISAFSTMALARSLPVAHFGLLLAVTLLVGFFADMVVLPFLLAGAKIRD